MDQTRTEKYSGIKGGRGRPRQPYSKIKGRKEYKRGTWIRDRNVSLPKNTIFSFNFFNSGNAFF